MEMLMMMMPLLVLLLVMLPMPPLIPLPIPPQLLLSLMLLLCVMSVSDWEIHERRKPVNIWPSTSSGPAFRSFATQTLPQFSNRPPPIGGWINDENEKDVCDRCINIEARRAAPAKLPDGGLAPCRICGRVPECPGYLVDERSLLANLSPKILAVVVFKLKSEMDLEVIFENWPLGAAFGIMRYLQSIVSGTFCCSCRCYCWSC